MPRTTTRELEKLVKRLKFGIKSEITGGVGVSKIGKRASNVETRNTGEVEYVERIIGQKLEGPKKIQIGVSGTVRVRITFHRTRLADYSRAISEKAWIDCAVYAGIIANDSEREICLEDGGQHKVETKAEERIEMEFFYPEVDYDNLWVEREKKVGLKSK